MGQYYRQAIEQDGNLDIFGTQTVNDWNGRKLMEHSWIGNSFMDAISERIHNKPANIVWCGDYADEPQDFVTIDWINYETIYPKDGRKPQRLKELPERFDYSHKYLVNHTNKCYVDFDLYMSKCKDKDGWILHPLSLLTAVGNGRGGGDYGDKCADYYMVGAWAGNNIEITDKVPDEYELEDVRFSEDENYDDDRVE